MKIKTNELTGAALDWAVAKCEGWEWRCPWMLEKDGFVAWQRYETAWGSSTPNYSTDWAQGGPIIERYCINIFRLDPKNEDDTNFWIAHIDGIFCRYGVSALTAAMRCYVASKLGDEVEIPEELTQ